MHRRGGQTESSSAAPEGATAAQRVGAAQPGGSSASDRLANGDSATSATAAAGETDGAQAQSTVTLAASSITRTGATLTISNHTAAWYWQRHSVAPGPCSSAVAANTATATLTDLSAATSYTYKAYSDATCSTELTNDSRDADFTTPGIVLSTFHTVVTEGSSATYTVKLATAPASDVTVTVSRAADRHPGVTVDTDSITDGNQSTLTFTSQNWDTTQTVTVQVAAHWWVWWDYWSHDSMSVLHDATSSDTKYSGASAANAVTVIDDSSSGPMLSASLVTATGATLSITNRARAWYYRGLAYPGTWGACTSVVANTASVTLSGLAPGTDYTYYAYSDSACTSEITEAVTRARFTTPGVKLSTLRLIAPEGSTATYRARLATKPAGNVTVTITKGAGGDSDLTVDTNPDSNGNQNTLTFTAANWDIPQTVTVAAAEESGSTDKAYGTAAFSHAATSGYTTTAASTLTVSEGDNDVCPGTTAVGGPSVTTGGLVDDCNTLLAAKTMLAGTSTAIDNWATTLAIASWTGIAVTNSRVSALVASNAAPKLDGTIPNTLGNLTSLTWLELGGNALSGQIPAEIGNLTSLTRLELGGNALSGQIPAEIGNLTSLTRLALRVNALSGQIPAEIGNLTSLTRLALGDNELSGRILAEIGNLTELVVLSLDYNQLSGQIPAEIGNLTELVNVVLHSNHLSGQIPTEIGDLANLERMQIGGNLLSGTIPTEVGNLTSLIVLDLADNQLTGQIPASIGNLAELVRLELDRNRLSGQIRAKIGNLSKLDDLGLSHNQLVGQIPAEIGNLTSMTSLALGYNLLSGSIPAELGHLIDLDVLRLEHNWLSGTVPKELGMLTPTATDKIGIRDNLLTGCIPASWHRYDTGSSWSNWINPQQGGRTLAVCDGVVLSDARPWVSEGSTADYTVRLSSAPSSTVTVTVSATGDSDITVDTDTTTGGNQDTLTFTTLNWATAQTVRLTAAQDTDAIDGTATLTHTAASSDSTYSGAVATAVATEADDETGLNAVSVAATGASLAMSNRSGSWYYQQSSPSQGTCATESTGGNGTADATGLTPNTAYTFKAYSDSACSAELTAATTDAEFTTASGVLLSRTHLDAAEGSTATYTVKLATAPSHSVTVALTKATGGDADLTFNPSSLTFTTTDWGTAQTVTVTAASDSDTDDGSAVLVHTPSSSDAKYNSSPASIKVTERDNDAVLSAYTYSAHNATLLLENVTGIWHFKQTAPIVGACLGPLNANDGVVTASLHNLSPGTSYTFKAYKAPNRNEACNSDREITTDDTDADFTTPSGGIVLSAHSLTVREGTTETYAVRLSKRPTADVTISITSTVESDTDLTVAPASLTFTTGNWNIAQTVTVTAGSDTDTADGAATFVHAATSNDDSYSNLSVTVTATESDSGGVSLAASSVSMTGATLTISGWTQDDGPWHWQRHSVVPGPCSAAVAAGTYSDSLTGLTPTTAYTFKAYTDSTCTTEITDDFRDAHFTTAGLVLSAPLVKITAGSSAEYTVKLATAPTANVTVTVSPDDPEDYWGGKLSVDTDQVTSGNQSTLTFTTQNWDTAQTVSVTATTGTDPWFQWDGAIVHDAASDDSTYDGDDTDNGSSVANAVAILGPSWPRLTVSAVTATSATLTISGWTQDDGDWYYQGSAVPGTRGSCTAVAAGTTSVRLTGLAPGTEHTYRAYNPSDCITEIGPAEPLRKTSTARFTTPGVMLSAVRLIAPEGGTAAYTARLATKPAGNVTVTVTRGSGSDSDLTVDTDPTTVGNQSTLAFTAANWNVPQTVTVAAAEETNSADKAYGTATFRHAATSGYTTTAASTLTVAEGDNDVCPGTTAVGGPNVTTGGLVDDCNTLLAAKTTLAGTSTAIDNWATTLAIGSWTGITVTDSRISDIYLWSELDGSLPNTIGNLTEQTSPNSAWESIDSAGRSPANSAASPSSFRSPWPTTS